MQKYDVIKLEVSNRIKEFCLKYLPAGYARGETWLCADYSGTKKGDSFNMTLSGAKSGLWFDFATQEGGSVIDLVMKQRRCSPTEAAQELIDFLGFDPSIGNESDRIVMPIPHELIVKKENIRDKNGRKPQAVYEYRNNDGDLLFYVCRYEGAGTKIFLPYCLHKRGDTLKWLDSFSGYKEKPIYNIENTKYAENILIVEGEKCADTANSVLPTGWCAVSWLGGAGAADKVDWTELKNKNLYVWPDNDEPGKKAADHIMARSGAMLVNITSDHPAKWDIADFIQDGASGEDVVKFIKDNVKMNSDPFLILGCDGVHYNYISKHDRFISATTAEHSRKTFLFELAPMEWWLTHFALVGRGGEIKGVDVDKAADYLITKSNELPTYTTKNVRGRGVHRDGNSIVLNTGKMIYIDHKLHNIKSTINKMSKIYIPKNPLPDPYGYKPLTRDERRLIPTIMEMFPFSDQAMQVFAAGWIAIAPISGMLSWRPHLWVTGHGESGKSTLFNRVFDKCLGQWRCKIQSQATTEASIRIELSNDTIPVLFDESESRTEREKIKLSSILDLVRQSSSESEDSYILKATQTQDVKKFYVRSMFALFSISCALERPEDFSRFALCNLDARYVRHPFTEVLEKLEEIKDDYAMRLMITQIKRYEYLLERIKFTSKAISNLGFGSRMGDQYAPLVVGFLSLEEDVITESMIESTIARINFREIRALQSESIDEMFVLTLLSEIIKTDIAGSSYSVSELFIMAGKDELYNKFLKRHGLARNGKYLVISTQNQYINKFIEKHNFPKNWSRIIRDSKFTTKEHEKSFTYRFNGATNNAVAILCPVTEEYMSQNRFTGASGLHERV